MAQKYTPPPIRKQATAAPVNVIPPAQFVFGRINYIIFLVAIAIVALGFILMSGTTDIYDFRKIVLAPLVVLSGFAIGFFAIFKKPETKA
jgi:hypothetical protein